MSAAVSSVPSCHFIPFFSFTIAVFAASSYLKSPSARKGIILPLAGAVLYRAVGWFHIPPQYIFLIMLQVSVNPVPRGFKMSGSFKIPILSMSFAVSPPAGSMEHMESKDWIPPNWFIHLSHLLLLYAVRLVSLIRGICGFSPAIIFWRLKALLCALVRSSIVSQSEDSLSYLGFLYCMKFHPYSYISASL